MRVGIAAAAQVPYHTDSIPMDTLLMDAVRYLEPQTDRSLIDAVLVSTNDTGRYWGTITSALSGLRPTISHTVESMCGSGGSAIVSAYSYVVSGMAKAVLVVGAERAESPGSILHWDVSRGQFQSPIYWASIMTKSYRRIYSVNPKELAAVAAKNRQAAQQTPGALGAGDYTIQDVLESRHITDELHLLECSRACSGSSAILVANEEICGRFPGPTVWIRGVGLDTAPPSLGSADSYHRLESVARAARRAYGMASITPSMIHTAEIHDAFSVCEPMVLEALQMAPPGRGARLCADLYHTQDRRINPRGGLLGCGHPLGATGISQAAEIFCQLRGEAGSRQVDEPHIGLTQGMSAAGTSSVVVVMQS